MSNVNKNNIILIINMNSTNHYTNRSLLDNDSSFNNYENLLLVERLTIYITFILSIIGIIGNIGTIIVLNQHAMRQWRSSTLLTALAITDFLYLSIIFLSIIDILTHQAIGLHRSLLLCQVTVYITHVCSFLSATFTLSFTLQRFVAVIFPLHAYTIISYRSSIINILLLIFISCTFYLFSFFLTNISNGQCREDEHYPALFPLLIIDICFTFVIPFICILLFNCAIVYKLHSRKKFTNNFEPTIGEGSRRHATDGPNERQRLYIFDTPTTHNDYIQLKKGRKIITKPCLEPKNLDHEYVTRQNNSHSGIPRFSYESVLPMGNGIKQQQTISQRTTKMLVICSTTFLIFNSPYCAVLCYSIISKHVLTRTLDILRHFYFMSFCLNFFLYSLCGNRFRHELILLLKKSHQKCFTYIFRQNCLNLYKFPRETSISRSTARTIV
ncbi:unnamed protein product [Rotaria sordida]|uniref:G-protein coupled receptors family 1 profile domain-containing protein n=1 Tax=Rotaria sordida TaxID=392033 RepID=A0A814LTN3_9BILA|nr:unnamed protein product [Rotaria sordida]CAF1070160.1 unnamed protein product [Rotaria sordida]